MAAYILKPDASAFSINRQTAYVGFTLLGEETQFFDLAEFDNLPLTTDDIVVGGIGFVHRALKRLGLAVPAIPSIPEELSDFALRQTWQTTIGEVRQAVANGQARFIKPCADQPKRFNGQPLRTFSDLIATAGLPDETVVECAELTPFVSEYRTFVLSGGIVDLRHYNGDPLLFPNAAVIRQAIERFETAPAAYAIDFGVCADGITRLVEVNDAYATGAYGLAPRPYAALITARWAQLRQVPALSEAAGIA